jgi:small subunit ribosomal protein S16
MGLPVSLVAAFAHDWPIRASNTEVNDLAVKIRLARAGAKKTPFYRVVIADARAPRDGRFIEIIGRYNPRTDPSTIEIDVDKVDAWLAKGAQPTEAVEKLIAIAKNPDREAPVREAKPSRKSAAKAAAAEAKPAEAAPVVAAETPEVAEAEEPAPAVAEAEEPVVEAALPEEAPAEEAKPDETTAEEAETPEEPEAEENVPADEPGDETPTEEESE